MLEAAIDEAIENDSDLLVEATSNQVNHRGGYTGMKPDHFCRRVSDIAAVKGLNSSRLIFGGDHLGPNPWQSRPASEAMREAELMVEAFVRAGCQKIHLDASMACADEKGPLSNETIARRAAQLCNAAERSAGARKPLYVIGTEVPTPGGATESLTNLEVTSSESAAATVAMHCDIFAEMGLGQAWPRVISLVVQPGVEFNHDSVVDYVPERALHLTELLKQEETLVYEAHSTDYQRPEAFRWLVRDGFAILKVGPALTFAMREALSALSLIEEQLVAARQRSRLMEVVERAMIENPHEWERHYSGDRRTVQLLRRYSYSDRIRYYWNVEPVKSAVSTLMSNLLPMAIPEPLLSAFLPEQYHAVRAGILQSDARSLVIHRIRSVLKPYADACRA